MKRGPTPKLIERIEAIEGGSLSEILTRCYLTEQLSYRALCRRWQINGRTIMRLLGHLGIAPRRGSDAVRSQWVHAPEERHLNAAANMSAIVRRMTSLGQHPRIGKTKETDAGTRTTAEKLRVSSSAYRPEVRVKNAASQRLRIRRNPLAHASTERPPTRAEAVMYAHLLDLGLKVLFNHIVATPSGPKWLNFYIPALNLAVECEHFSRFPLSWERHAEISALGVRVVYITNKHIHRRRFGGLDQYVSRLQSIRPHPAAHGQNAVVWGRINESVFDLQPDHVTIKPVSMDGGHTLFIATAPDDPVIQPYLLDRPPA